MKKKEKLWGFVLIAPLSIGILMFVLVPFLYSLFVAFSEYDLINPPKFTGLENARRMFTDQYFRQSLKNSFLNLLGVPIAMALSLGAAVLLTKVRRLSNFFRSVFFLPAICSSVAVSFMWKYMLDYNYGIINWALERLGLEKILFLSGKTAMPSMILMGVWGGIGIIILLYYSALQNVPRMYYEAAMIDGAGAWQQFLKITLPAISPITLYILVTQLIGALQDSTRFMVMSGNGNMEELTTAGVYVYRQTFTFGAPGYGSMVAWALGLVIMACTILNFIFSKKWVSYDS